MSEKRKHGHRGEPPEELLTAEVADQGGQAIPASGPVQAVEVIDRAVASDPLKALEQEADLLQGIAEMMFARFGEGWQPVQALARAHQRLRMIYKHLKSAGESKGGAA